MQKDQENNRSSHNDLAIYQFCVADCRRLTSKLPDLMSLSRFSVPNDVLRHQILLLPRSLSLSLLFAGYSDGVFEMSSVLDDPDIDVGEEICS